MSDEEVKGVAKLLNDYNLGRQPTGPSGEGPETLAGDKAEEVYRQNRNYLFDVGMQNIATELGVSKEKLMEAYSEITGDAEQNLTQNPVERLASILDVKVEKLSEAMNAEGFIEAEHVALMTGEGMWGIGGSYKTFEFIPDPKKVSVGVDYLAIEESRNLDREGRLNDYIQGVPPQLFESGREPLDLGALNDFRRCLDPSAAQGVICDNGDEPKGNCVKIDPAILRALRSAGE